MSATEFWLSELKTNPWIQMSACNIVIIACGLGYLFVPVIVEKVKPLWQ